MEALMHSLGNPKGIRVVKKMGHGSARIGADNVLWLRVFREDRNSLCPHICVNRCRSVSRFVSSLSSKARSDVRKYLKRIVPRNGKPTR
jgi:hypothetical protein